MPLGMNGISDEPGYTRSRTCRGAVLAWIDAGVDFFPLRRGCGTQLLESQILEVKGPPLPGITYL